MDQKPAIAKTRGSGRRLGAAARLAAALACAAIPVACRASDEQVQAATGDTGGPQAKEVSSAAPGSAAPGEAPGAPSASPEARPKPPEREIAGAAHILVAYKGAERAPKGVVRTKEQARKRAEEALGKVKEGKDDFAALAKKYSDDETSKAAGGMIGNFERNVMPEAFSTATFSMDVGQTSDIVETPLGFHIVRRTR